MHVNDREGGRVIATVPQLLTTQEVARALRCSPKRVRDLVTEGRLEVIRLSPAGRMKFKAEDVRALIDGEGS